MQWGAKLRECIWKCIKLRCIIIKQGGSKRVHFEVHCIGKRRLGVTLECELDLQSQPADPLWSFSFSFSFKLLWSVIIDHLGWLSLSLTPFIKIHVKMMITGSGCRLVLKNGVAPCHAALGKDWCEESSGCWGDYPGRKSHYNHHHHHDHRSPTALSFSSLSHHCVAAWKPRWQAK